MDEFELGFSEDTERTEVAEDSFDEGYLGQSEESPSREERIEPAEHRGSQPERHQDAYQAPVVPEPPEDVLNFYEDFPEAKQALDHELNRRLAGVGEALAIDRWERAVVSGFTDKNGNYVEGVADYRRIAAPNHKEYWDWYASKGYGPCEPATAIARLKEWQKRQTGSGGEFAAGFKEK